MEEVEFEVSFGGHAYVAGEIDSEVDVSFCVGRVVPLRCAARSVRLWSRYQSSAALKRESLLRRWSMTV